MGGFLIFIGLLGIIVFIIMAIVSVFKRTGKAKKRLLLAVGCFVVMFIGGALMPDAKETTSSESKVQDKKDKSDEKAEAEAKVKAEAEAEAKAKAEAEAKAKEEAEAQRLAEEKKKQEEEAARLAAEQERIQKEEEAKALAAAEEERKRQEAEAQAAAQQQATNVYFKNCDAVRAAGAAPIRQGQPGYAKHLDRDGDGIGCDQ